MRRCRLQKLSGLKKVSVSLLNFAISNNLSIEGIGNVENAQSVAMKWLNVVVFLVGLTLLYFIDVAFRLNLFHAELLVHSLIRFFIGFILLGVSVFYAHWLRFKMAGYIALALVLGDDVWDYFRDVNSFRFEIMLHSLYLLCWGALSGYTAARTYRQNNDE